MVQSKKSPFTKPGLPKDFLDSDRLIEHAKDCWDAEQINAERLANRVKTMITAVVAIFGLGLFKLQWFISSSSIVAVQSPRMATGIRWSLSIAVGFFALTFFYIIGGGSERKSVHASSGLSIPPTVLRWITQLSDEERRKHVFYCKYRAYMDLKKRNIEKHERIENAQFYFIIGIVATITAIMLYIWNAESQGVPIE